MAQKENFQAQLDNILSKIVSKPTLLLHACCAPCSSYVLEYLAQFFDITIYYYNPNIFPPAEYARRLSELEKFLGEFPEAVRAQIKFVKADYNPEEYYTATNVRNEAALQTEHERGERCRRCYELRMRQAYSYAAAYGYDWFCTTLSISPHKDAEKINTIGREIEAAAVAKVSAGAAASDAASASRASVASRETGDSEASAASGHVTRWLPSDFKKRGGFKRSLEISCEYNLYRQDYCGCEFSAKNRH